MAKTSKNSAELAESPVPDRRQKVHSAEVGMDVLKALARVGGSSSLKGLAEHLDENPAKIHRYLVSLISAELVNQDPISGHYFLGHEAILVGIAAMRRSEPISCAAEEMLLLSDSQGLASNLAVLGNRGPTIVRWQDPDKPIAVNVRIGSVLPVLWSALGRIFAAYSRSGEVGRMAREELTQASASQLEIFPDLNAVQTMLTDIRRWECAPIRDVMLPGLSAIAAPIFDAEGRLVAAISILGMSSGFDESPGGELARTIKDSAARVSRRLGWTPDSFK
jgi:DNA-binding IclR family transcriptional regulator